MTEKRRLKIADLEKASGVPRSTIHHYLHEGILHPPFKTGQTMSYYDDSHIRRLETIQKIKLDFLKQSKRSRAPLDLIKHQLQEGYTLSKAKGDEPGDSAKITNEKSQKRKNEIIEAALRLYSNRGYYLTNVRDIAKDAGISPPTFYLYFPDKRDLFVEAIEYVISNIKRDIEDSLSKEQNPIMRQIIMFRGFLDNYSKIGEVLNQLRAGVAINDQWAKEKLIKVYRDLMEILIKELDEGIRLGKVRDMDRELLAFFILSLTEASIHRASLDNKYSVEQLAIFLDLFAKNGYLTREGIKDRSSTNPDLAF